MPGRVRIFCEFVLTKTGDSAYAIWKATAKIGELLRCGSLPGTNRFAYALSSTTLRRGMFRRSPMNVAFVWRLLWLVTSLTFPMMVVLRGPRFRASSDIWNFALPRVSSARGHRPIWGPERNRSQLDRDHAPRRGVARFDCQICRCRECSRHFRHRTEIDRYEKSSS